MRKTWLLIIGLLFLIGIEIAKVYFIMPFPGSQQSNSIDIAYFLHNNIWWMRILGVVIVVVPFRNLLSNGKLWQKIILIAVVLLYGFIYYLFNFRFLADKMFYQPKQKTFVEASLDTTQKDKLVIGVVINHEAKAYPIEIIGYHHQVQDSLQQQPIIVTYCTVCRTGRVYSPMVNGKHEEFRLVGMDHFNAMFEDASTKSWWQQATGMAITGKMKGYQLTEIPSVQMRLGDWLNEYPNSTVLQPDSNFKKKYDSLKGYDEGTIKGSLEHRDTGSWKFKSWVVGISLNGKQKAYDWNELVKAGIINDTLSETPVLLTVEPGNKTFYVANRYIHGQKLEFIHAPAGNLLEDLQTHSTWKLNGEAIAGPLSGSHLERIQAYQEFWHSWKYFHPATTSYRKP